MNNRFFGSWLRSVLAMEASRRNSPLYTVPQWLWSHTVDRSQCSTRHSKHCRRTHFPRHAFDRQAEWLSSRPPIRLDKAIYQIKTLLSCLWRLTQSEPHLMALSRRQWTNALTSKNNWFQISHWLCPSLLTLITYLDEDLTQSSQLNLPADCRQVEDGRVLWSAPAAASRTPFWCW